MTEKTVSEQKRVKSFKQILKDKFGYGEKYHYVYLTRNMITEAVKEFLQQFRLDWTNKDENDYSLSELCKDEAIIEILRDLEK